MFNLNSSYYCILTHLIVAFLCVLLFFPNQVCGCYEKRWWWSYDFTPSVDGVLTICGLAWNLVLLINREKTTTNKQTKTPNRRPINWMIGWLPVWQSPTCLFLLLPPIVSKKSFSRAMSRSLSPVFSFRNFTVSGFTLNWFLCMMLDKGTVSLFCIGITNFPSTIWEETILSPLCMLGTLIEDQ